MNVWLYLVICKVRGTPAGISPVHRGVKATFTEGYSTHGAARQQELIANPLL